MDTKAYRHSARKLILKNKLITTTLIVISLLGFDNMGLRAECSLNIQSSVRSGWNKKSVSYDVEGNTIKIKVDEMGWDDADSIFIGSIIGCSTLTVNVSQISGNYPWEGKAIGISFANEIRETHQWGNAASFPPPRGYKINDGFVKAGLSNNTKLIYDIPNSSLISYIGAKIFLGSYNAMELQFSAQDASDEPRLSKQKQTRSSRRLTANTGDHSDKSTISCALDCPVPQKHGQFALTRDFLTSLLPDCRN